MASDCGSSDRKNCSAVCREKCSSLIIRSSQGQSKSVIRPSIKIFVAGERDFGTKRMRRVESSLSWKPRTCRSGADFLGRMGAAPVRKTLKKTLKVSSEPALGGVQGLDELGGGAGERVAAA